MIERTNCHKLERKLSGTFFSKTNSAPKLIYYIYHGLVAQYWRAYSWTQLSLEGTKCEASKSGEIELPKLSPRSVRQDFESSTTKPKINSVMPDWLTPPSQEASLAGLQASQLGFPASDQALTVTTDLHDQVNLDWQGRPLLSAITV